MKKGLYLLLFILISVIFINKTNAGMTNISYNVLGVEKIFFNASTPQVVQLNSLLNITLENKCYDNNNIETNKISFVCKNQWVGTTRAGCGLIRNDNYDELKGYYCTLKRIDKDIGLKFNLDIKQYIISDNTNAVQGQDNITSITYPIDYDISKNMVKKSIQSKELSCESSATSDILTSVLGYNITEDDILNKLQGSFFGKEASISNGKRIWGDPDVGFVGYIDKIPKTGAVALQWKYQGYGVYELPLSKVYSSYNVKNTIINQYNRDTLGLKSNKEQLVYLLQNLYSGNFVQLWGDTCTYPQYEDGVYKGKLTTALANNGKSGVNSCLLPYSSRVLTWYYKKDDGTLKTITGLNGEHAYYLLGYKGDINNPTHIIVWDTNTGKHTYPTVEWLRKWGKMNDRSILVSSK